jgi:hypothetical protein
LHWRRWWSLTSVKLRAFLADSKGPLGYEWQNDTSFTIQKTRTNLRAASFIANEQVGKKIPQSDPQCVGTARKVIFATATAELR